MTERLSVIALSSDITKAPGWWRITKPFEWLQRHGVNAQVHGFDAINKIDDAWSGAVIVLQRTITDRPNELISNLRALNPRKIIYETDDDIFTEAYSQYFTDMQASEAQKERYRTERILQTELMRLCDEVTVTTQYLKNVVARYTDKVVHVLPNSLDVEWYRERIKKKYRAVPDYNENVVIGWAGGMRPDYDLWDLAEAWSYIDETFDNVRFAIGGFQPNNILFDAVDYDKITFTPYASLDEWPGVMSVDIGCVPLSPKPFNYSKSPIKVLEYWGAGAAVVASPTVYGEVVKALSTGLVATTVEDWKIQLSSLVQLWPLRQVMADRGLKALKEHYSMEANYQKWIDAYES